MGYVEDSRMLARKALDRNVIVRRYTAGFSAHDEPETTEDFALSVWARREDDGISFDLDVDGTTPDFSATYVVRYDSRFVTTKRLSIQETGKPERNIQSVTPVGRGRWLRLEIF